MIIFGTLFEAAVFARSGWSSGTKMNLPKQGNGPPAGGVCLSFALADASCKIIPMTFIEPSRGREAADFLGLLSG